MFYIGEEQQAEIEKMDSETMISFDKARWVDRLARALTKVVEVQKYYWDELDERRRLEQRRETDRTSSFPMSDPSSALRWFYSSDCWREGIYFENHYAPMRKVLEVARDIVGQHPAVADVSRRDGHLNEFGARFLTRSISSSRLAMVAGLICRADQVGKDGFRVASTELNALLDPSNADEVGPDFGNLDLGYHVAVFYGLQFDERFEISEDVEVVPLEHMDAFLEKDVLVRVEPRVVNWKSVGTIIKRFWWKPPLFSLDSDPPDVDWDTPPFSDAGSFFEHAREFVELLGVTHKAPVIYLTDLGFCFDRRASLLFGQPHYHSDVRSKTWEFLPGGWTQMHPLDRTGMEQAIQLFKQPDLDGWKYKPVISRLAEALARGNRYASEDKIVDVAIALERMYEIVGQELTYRLKTRAACYLEVDMEGRKRVFNDLDDFYNARSKIVHGRKSKAQEMEKVSEDQRTAFETGFEVARRTLIKLLREGPPENWNDMVLK